MLFQRLKLNMSWAPFLPTFFEVFINFWIAIFPVFFPWVGRGLMVEAEKPEKTQSP